MPLDVEHNEYLDQSLKIEVANLEKGTRFGCLFFNVDFYKKVFVLKFKITPI